MAEEAKKECCCVNPKALLKLILGVVIILLGIGLTIRFFWALKIMVAGCLGPFLVLVGLITVAIAKE